jgi:flagellar hook-associated protein 3 FlgL
VQVAHAVLAFVQIVDTYHKQAAEINSGAQWTEKRALQLTAAISSSLTSLDTGIGQVSAATGSVGGRVKRLDDVQDILAADLTRTKGLLSRVEDADVAATLIEFQQQEQLFQSALNAAGRLIQPSLMDFLR